MRSQLAKAHRAARANGEFHFERCEERSQLGATSTNKRCEARANRENDYTLTLQQSSNYKSRGEGKPREIIG